MKKVTVLVAALALGISMTVLASPHNGYGHGYSSEDRVEKMAERLNLTAEQQQKITQIMEAQHAKMKASHDAVHAEIGKILTDEQKQKFEEMREHRQGKYGKKHRGCDDD